MPSIGDPCWRDAGGLAAMELPFRVAMPDGSTRTDSTQWGEDSDVLAATGWTRSTLTQDDLDLLYPPAPPLSWLDAGYQTADGWRLGCQADDVALLTGLYVLAARANQLGVAQPCVVTDMAGERHTLTFEEFEALMLAYGAARAAASAGGGA
jgi:hypothetical protein